MGVSAAGARIRLGMTCWRRLRDWTEAGVGCGRQLHEVLLAELNVAGLID